MNSIQKYSYMNCYTTNSNISGNKNCKYNSNPNFTGFEKTAENCCSDNLKILRETADKFAKKWEQKIKELSDRAAASNNHDVKQECQAEINCIKSILNSIRERLYTK